MADSLLALGHLLLMDGRAEQAEPHLRESLGLWQRWPAEERIRIATTQSLLGSSLLARARYLEAEPLILDSARTLVESLGEQHRTSRRAVGRVVELYERWGKPEDAARARERLSLSSSPQ